MNVVIYTHGFAPLVGGVETYVMLLAEGVTHSGVPVTLITETPRGSMDDAGVPFRLVRQPRFFELFKLLREAEVVQLAGPCLLPLGMAILLRKPVVLEHHGYQSICPNGLLLYEPTKTVCPGHFMAGRYSKCLRCNAQNSGYLRSSLQLLLTFLRLWASRLVAANALVTRHVENRIPVPRSKVIYHGIPDPHKDSDRIPAGSQCSPGGPPVFGYVGRLVSEKGVPILLHATKELVDAGYSFRLKIVGDGPDRARLRETVESLGLGSTVTFTGSLTGAALLTELASLAAVVMPSVWEETAGLSAMEQMMRGGVVVASDIGGLGEIVGNAGLKFPAGDARGLAACLRRLLDEPLLVSQLGEKARQRAQELFSHERMVQGHLSLYREISTRMPRASLQPL